MSRLLEAAALLSFLLTPTLGADTTWHEYVRAPNSTLIYPARILSTHGNVTHAKNLLSPGGGVATLSRASPADDAPAIVVDFGQDIVGFPIFSFAGASSNGPGVRVAFSETKEYLTNVSDFSRSYNGDTITPGSDQFVVPATPTIWTDTHGCLYNQTQVCADGLHGFRYLRIYLDALDSDAPYASPYGTVEIDFIALNFTALLGTPDTFTGWFECSDTQLTQFWFDAAYTNELCTDTFLVNTTEPRGAASPSLIGKQVIFDGAKRDRDPYVGDLAVSARTMYLTHNNSIAAKNVLVDLAEHQRSDGWIPPASINNYTLPLFDYPLWWVTCSLDLVLYTGDTDYATTYYPVLLKVLDEYYFGNTNGTSGLLSKGVTDGSDGYGDYAFLPRTGEVTYYNALYVAALRAGAQLATIVGDHSADSKRWTQRATQVSAAINKNLWNDHAGAYIDSPQDPNITYAQDGNSLAVLHGIASPTRAKSTLNFMDTKLHTPYGNAFFSNDVLGQDFSKRVYAFLSYFEISARFVAGQADSALEEINRLYGWMAGHDPEITFWEGIGPKGSQYEQGYTSDAHGWSTGVLPALSNYVLGVVPTGAGFKTFTVKPYPAGNITWAKGEVPTPYGPILVSWTNGAAGFSVNVTAPAGTSGSVSVPVGTASERVAVNSSIAWDGKSVAHSAMCESGYVSLAVAGGQMYAVEVSNS